MNARQKLRAAATAVLAVGTAVVVAGPAPAASARDSQPPTITFGVWRYTVGTALSGATSAARVPITITWKQHDSDDIVEQQGYYDDSQGFHDEYSNYPSPGDPPYQSFSTTMPANGSATFNLQSIDGADNVGSDTSSHHSTLVQQGSFTRSGAWASRSDGRFSGGSAIVSTRAGDSATVRFTGSSFALVTRTGPSAGRARIYVDGNQVATIDTSSATTTFRVLSFQRQWAARGTHTVRVVAVSAAAVTLDAAVSN
jgi:hypothetical protein